MTENEMSTFIQEDWRKTRKARNSSAFKVFSYDLLRPFLAMRAARHLPAAYRRSVGANMVLFTRGTPLPWLRRWAAAHTRLAGASIWVAGTGDGVDALGWASLRPARIVATDLFAFEPSWEAIAREARDRFGVRLEFRQAPLEEHSFLDRASIDLCVSDAVFEHCRDLPSVLREMGRVVRPGGHVYASYGPLWFAPGGDHFSGRDGLESAYNHVLMCPEDYRTYYQAHRRPVEAFQDGGRFVELDLFSRLTTRQYLAAYAQAGLALDQLILQLSPESLTFRQRFPDRWAMLAEATRLRCEPADLLIKANFIRLRRP